MSVIFTRTATPLPGKHVEALKYVKERAAALKSIYGVDAQVSVRLGGPLGQVITVSRHKTLQEVEDLRRKVMVDAAAGSLPTSTASVFQSVEDAIWMST